MIKLRGTTWWADFYDAEGKRVRKTLNTEDKKVAKEMALKMRAGIKLKATEAKGGSYGPTLSEAYKQALREYKSWRDSTAPKTIAKNRKAIEDHFGADSRLSSINREALVKFMDSMRDAGLAGSTINQRVSQLSVLFNEAIDHWGYTELVKPRFVREAVADGRTRRFTPDEEAEAIEKLRSSTKLHHADVADAVAVLFDTGARLNEIVRLSKTAVNLSERLIIAWNTKNKQPRGIPMTDRVYQIMESRAHLAEPFGMLTDNIVSKAWAWVRDEMGFAADKEFVLHVMRHTVGSRLADANVSAPLIQQMLGHKNIATTQKYIHVSAAGLRGVADVLAKSSSVGVTKSVPKCDQNMAISGDEEVVLDEPNSLIIKGKRVVKLVDAGDSKSPAARRAGSIPAPGTTQKPTKSRT